MWIQNKIEEIKRKPEHIRIRYAWGAAIFFTSLVIILWIISLTTQNSPKEEQNPIFSPEEMQSFENLKIQKDSLQKATDNMKQSYQIQQSPTIGTQQGVAQDPSVGDSMDNIGGAIGQ